MYLVFCAQGEIYYAQRHYGKAVLEFEKAGGYAAVDEAKADALYRKGHALAKQGDHEKAIDCWKNAKLLIRHLQASPSKYIYVDSSIREQKLGIAEGSFLKSPCNSLFSWEVT